MALVYTPLPSPHSRPPIFQRHSFAAGTTLNQDRPLSPITESSPSSSASEDDTYSRECQEELNALKSELKRATLILWDHQHQKNVFEDDLRMMLSIRGTDGESKVREMERMVVALRRERKTVARDAKLKDAQSLLKYWRQKLERAARQRTPHSDEGRSASADGDSHAPVSGFGFPTPPPDREPFPPFEVGLAVPDPNRYVRGMYDTPMSSSRPFSFSLYYMLREDISVLDKEIRGDQKVIDGLKRELGRLRREMRRNGIEVSGGTTWAITPSRGVDLGWKADHDTTD